MYYSDPLIALYERHPEDIRFTAYCERLNPDEPTDSRPRSS